MWLNIKWTHINAMRWVYVYGVLILQVDTQQTSINWQGWVNILSFLYQIYLAKHTLKMIGMKLGKSYQTTETTRMHQLTKLGDPFPHFAQHISSNWIWEWKTTLFKKCDMVTYFKATFSWGSKVHQLAILCKMKF